MNRLPEIGERVRYRSVSEWWDRACTGTVRKIFEGFDSDTLRTIPVGAPGWAERWAATVEVDGPLPEWWGYSDNEFAPRIEELEPLDV